MGRAEVEDEDKHEDKEDKERSEEETDEEDANEEGGEGAREGFDLGRAGCSSSPNNANVCCLTASSSSPNNEALTANCPTRAGAELKAMDEDETDEERDGDRDFSSFKKVSGVWEKGGGWPNVEGFL